MKISDLLQSGRKTLSFEVFPPKTDTAFDSVREATEKIASLSPDFISVTYGAGGGTSQYTLDIACNIEKKYRIPVLVHLTCVSSDRMTVLDRLTRIKKSGIENVMALRGDIPPQLEGKDRSKWDYHYAVDLIHEIRGNGYDFTISGACYPEKHPESATVDEDIRYLREKSAAGCSFLTTQMFFDNSILYSFLYRIREAGINIPVVPGIMPITNSKQVERAIRLSGSHVPRRFMAIVDKFGDHPDAMMQAGIAYATDQIIDLYANGIKNVHVYTMNKPEVAMKIKENLSFILDC